MLRRQLIPFLGVDEGLSQVEKGISFLALTARRRALQPSRQAKESKTY